MIQGIENYINLTDTKNEWAKFLNGFEWHWFFTLTFDKKVSDDLAYKQFFRWKNWIKSSVGHRIFYLIIPERPKYKGDNTHIHGFLNGVENEKPYIWRRKWEAMAGFSRIQPYDSSRGASYYLADKIVFKEEDIYHSKDLNMIKINTLN
ncbi:MAG: hypothetical protein WC359_05190 [Dehalococcoidia bacterium]|jgi:hypothetical protein